MYIMGGARGVMVMVVGNGPGDMSSNPGQDWFYILYIYIMMKINEIVDKSNNCNGFRNISFFIQGRISLQSSDVWISFSLNKERNITKPVVSVWFIRFFSYV